MKRPGAFGGEGEHARLPQAFQATGKVCMALQGGVFMVIQARAAQALVVQLEADRLDQMQSTTAVGAQPDNVASIGRNLWLKKDHVKHARHRTEGRAAFYS